MTNRKVNIHVAFSILLAICSITFTSLDAGAASTIKLRVGHGQPTVHYIHKVLTAWAEKVEKATDGRVELRIYPVGTLCPPAEIYEALTKGLMDIGCAPEGYTAARFPLNMGATIAMLGAETAQMASDIRMQLLDKFPEMRDEYKDVHVLWLSSHAGGNIHTKSPVSTLKDLDNMQLRAAPGLPPLVKALGAIPVAMPMPETYEAMQKGLVQGFLGTDGILKSFKLADVSAATTVLRLYSGAFFVAVNKETWENLPDDIKEIMTKLAKEGQQDFSAAADAEGIAGLEYAKSRGNEIIYPTQEAKEEIYGKVRSIAHAAWAENMEEKGKPGKAILEELHRLIENYPK